MSFLKKIFSSSFRQALALEGAGRYAEAAQHYMLAGERAQVARMHRLSARDEADPYRRVDALRKALDFAAQPIDDPAIVDTRRQIRAELADALVALATHSGLLDRRDKGLLEEAAQIYVEFGAHGKAGEVFARLGFLNKAAESFEAAGDIGRMEEMYKRVESVDRSEVAFDRAFDAYEFAQMAGDPIGALEALSRCVELRPQDAGLVARLQSLRERMPASGRLTLRGPAGAWVLMGGDALGIGREDDNEILLLDPGVSRKHARIVLRDGLPVLEDLGSSHGTWLDEARIAAHAPLPRQGRLRVGKAVTLRYRFGEKMMPPGIFEVVDGYLKGQTFTWTPRVLTTGSPPDQPRWLPPGLALEFRRGCWHVVPEMCAGVAMIAGSALNTPTILRIGDELDFGGLSLRVE